MSIGGNKNSWRPYGEQDERFQSNASNTNLEISGARLAPIDQLAEVREQERREDLSARRRRATRRAVIKREA
jgi:hypothetical protein